MSGFFEGDISQGQKSKTDTRVSATVTTQLQHTLTGGIRFTFKKKQKRFREDTGISQLPPCIRRKR